VKKEQISRPSALAQRREEDEAVIEFQVRWKNKTYTQNGIRNTIRSFFPVARLKDLGIFERNKIH
jgi:hypothetical protein